MRRFIDEIHGSEHRSFVLGTREGNTIYTDALIQEDPEGSYQVVFFDWAAGKGTCYRAPTLSRAKEFALNATAPRYADKEITNA